MIRRKLSIYAHDEMQTAIIITAQPNKKLIKTKMKGKKHQLNQAKSTYDDDDVD